MNEGPRGLFAGYNSFLLRDLPFDAIEFMAYEQLKVAYTRFLNGKRKITPQETAVLGTLPNALLSIWSMTYTRGCLHALPQWQAEDHASRDCSAGYAAQCCAFVHIHAICKVAYMRFLNGKVKITPQETAVLGTLPNAVLLFAFMAYKHLKAYTRFLNGKRKRSPPRRLLCWVRCPMPCFHLRPRLTLKVAYMRFLNGKQKIMPQEIAVLGTLPNALLSIWSMTYTRGCLHALPQWQAEDHASRDCSAGYAAQCCAFVCVHGLRAAQGLHALPQWQAEDHAPGDCCAGYAAQCCAFVRVHGLYSNWPTRASSMASGRSPLKRLIAGYAAQCCALIRVHGLHSILPTCACSMASGSNSPRRLLCSVCCHHLHGSMPVSDFVCRMPSRGMPSGGMPSEGRPSILPLMMMMSSSNPHVLGLLGTARARCAD